MLLLTDYLPLILNGLQPVQVSDIDRLHKQKRIPEAGFQRLWLP